MKLIKVKLVQLNKGLAFFKAWKIILLLIPPFLLYVMVLVVIAVIKKIGSFVPPKFRIWLLLLIPVAMIMVYIK